MLFTETVYDLPADAAPATHPAAVVPAMPASPRPAGPRGFALRDYQAQDVEAFEAAIAAGRRAVVCRHATGLGKSVVIAELCRRMSPRGRILVTVDVTNLAESLSQTIYQHLGHGVGVLTGGLKDGWRHAEVVVSTVQTMYAGGEGREWYRLFDPAEFAAVFVDECETSIAPQYSAVIRHFMQNPRLVVCGLSATPFRADGRGMRELFDHAEQHAGPLNRDILWGRDNGWLVPIRQAFVRVSLDFSTLKLKRNDDGERDYTDADLARLLESEQALVELAKGVHAVAQAKPSVIICPGIDAAERLAHWLNAANANIARAVHGGQGRLANDLIARFKRGEFPYIVSVNKLYKGFDADTIRYVFMARKTRSRRLYEQAMGRGTRPLGEIRAALGAAADPEARRAIIAASAKPYMVMVDLVGIDESAKDLMGVIDVLGRDLSDAAKERAKRKMMEDPKPDTDPEEVGREAEKETKEEERRREEQERQKRRIVQVHADVEVEVTDDLRAGGMRAIVRSDVPLGQLAVLEQGGVPDDHVRRMTPDQIKWLSSELVRRWKKRLASYRQCLMLRRRGYSREILHDMTRQQASDIISSLRKAA